MSMLRFKVAKEAFSRKAVPVNEPKERPSEYFGKYVFNREKMFKYLPKKTYEAVIEAIDNSTPLSREVADSVAAGMRKWALEMGATHYTHWFDIFLFVTTSNFEFVKSILSYLHICQKPLIGNIPPPTGRILPRECLRYDIHKAIDRKISTKIIH